MRWFVPYIRVKGVSLTGGGVSLQLRVVSPGRKHHGICRLGLAGAAILEQQRPHRLTRDLHQQQHQTPHSHFERPGDCAAGSMTSQVPVVGRLQEHNNVDVSYNDPAHSKQVPHP